MRMANPDAGSKRIAGTAVPGVHLMGIDHTSRLYRGVKEHFSVAWMLSGRADIWRRGRTRAYAAGAIIASRVGDVHNDRQIATPVSYRIAMFDPEHVQRARTALGLPVHRELDIGEIDPRAPDAERVRNMHRTLFASRAEVAEQEEAIQGGLTALISLSRAVQPRELHEAPAFVRRAQDFMREHQHDGLRLADAAQAAGIDQFRLIRAFRQHVGMSPYEWLTHLRIQRAKLLLAAGHTASDVAQQLGYCDQSQLHRHFRRIVGATPGAYAREVSRRAQRYHCATSS